MTRYRQKMVTLFEATSRTGVRKKELRRAVAEGKLFGRIHGNDGEVSAAGLRRFVATLPVHDAGEPERVSKITIPERCHPFAGRVFAEMKRQGVTYDELHERSGVLKSTFKAWRTNNQPGLDTIEAALAALGFRLEVVPIEPEEARDGRAAGPTPPRPHGAIAAGRDA